LSLEYELLFRQQALADSHDAEKGVTPKRNSLEWERALLNFNARAFVEIHQGVAVYRGASK
jgi:hypothetical protein